MTRVYLAGPDVFLPDPESWLARKQAICAAYALVGVSPLDPLPDEPTAWADWPLWRRIALRNEAHIRSCAGVLANLTPFRGPSADVGTVYEIGFARGIGLRVFGYATIAAPFLDRTLAMLGGQPGASELRDDHGMLIESFGLYDNLMIEAGIIDSGGSVVIEERDRWRDLSVFEQCVAKAAAVLTGA